MSEGRSWPAQSGGSRRKVNASYGESNSPIHGGISRTSTVFVVPPDAHLGFTSRQVDKTQKQCLKALQCWGTFSVFEISQIPWSHNKSLAALITIKSGCAKTGDFQSDFEQTLSLVPRNWSKYFREFGTAGIFPQKHLFALQRRVPKNINLTAAWCLSGVTGEGRSCLIGGKYRGATVTFGWSFGKWQVHRLKCSSKCRRNVLAKDLWQHYTGIREVYLL